ncbi:3-methylornithyl-N6-L-lysine dehydrogenase PylD [Methanolapillus millepedarum]|uniref:Pyrrolysine biosynthesis protein PylD N-terminal domain-containing protein n=1 Tax=Methanolapillus millepedarum TaxID=3028296 RepID=A0AA96V356_9EURY|nr:hypothetical protein MsAc7_12620 [Methanosarcinaceae archaeon Ac7]
MALLTPDDLQNMTDALVENDNLVRELTGFSLDRLCADVYKTEKKNEKIAIIPVTAGCGIIGRFSESLLFTVKHFGMNGFITKNTDVAGFYEAVTGGADIILMADDLAFIAYNLRNQKIAHNQICTGRVYAEILCRTKISNLMSKKEVLVIGLGKVGTPALETFLIEGYSVSVFDADSNRLNEVVADHADCSSGKVKPYDPNSNSQFDKIFEATPAANTVPESCLKNNSVLSTPGIPCGLSKALQEKYGVKIVQEPLGIGTLSMLYAVFDEK